MQDDHDRTQTTTGVLDRQTPAESNRPSSDSDPPKRRPRKRRLLRTALSILAVVIAVSATSAWWALDEYVIDHVEIADVAAYEAAVVATTSPVPDTTSVDNSLASGEVAAAEVFLSETSYADESVSIEISTVVTGGGDETVTYYIADVELTDATDLRAGFANNQFGTNIVEDTSEIAEDNDAIFAINGDYYGFRDTGIVIRNGVIYRDDGARSGLAIYVDGTMEVYDETVTTAEELVASGVWNTLSFGPALLEAGEVVDGIEEIEIDTNFGNHSIQGEQPRTGIGIIDEGHFVFVVVDGRSPGYSAGVTMSEFAEIFQDLGATVAYNLDGGGSATMYFNGELVNNPLGKGTERGTSDILYIAADSGATS